MNNKIKIVVAGAANPHIPQYCRQFAENNEYPWEIVAIAEENPALLDNIRKIIGGKTEYFKNWRKMLDVHPQVDCMQIGGNNIEHFDMFTEAIDRNMNIYSPKVPTMNEDEGQKLLQMTKNYSKVIQVELELHFSPQYKYARKLVQEQKLGQLSSIYLSNVSQSPCHCFPNWGDPELSYGNKVPIRPGSKVYRGGGLTDHPHPFDLIRWITGREFKTVYAMSARNQRENLKVEDHIAITGLLDDGTEYFINPSYSNLEEPVPTRRLYWPKSLECNLKLTGKKGYYTTDFFQKSLYVLGKNHQSPNRLIVDLQSRYNLSADTLEGCFRDCVLGKRDTPESTLSDALTAVKVMNAVYESVYHDKEIYL